MDRRRHTRLVPLVAVGGAVATAAMLASPPLASAQTARTHHHTIIAHSLNSPRLLSFGPDGSLYVAEAGQGGDGPCATGGDGTTVCFGTTGSITRVKAGHQRRVLKDLPSLAGANGSEPVGPADVHVTRHRHFAISMGAGIDLQARRGIGHAAHRMGTVLEGKFGHRGHIVADIVKFEWLKNPDHSSARDSDPGGLTATRHGYLVADAGGNTLLRTRTANRSVHTVAVFPARLADLPPMVGGGKAPMQSVPTAVAVGPHHALFVSELTGFPFPMGGARIYRIVPGQTPRVWATGLTNVTDLEWHGGHLYAVQLANEGLLAVPPGNLPTGSLVRVHRGANKNLHVIAGHLVAPYGVVVRHRHAYVSTCSVCTGKGEVIRVPLR